ncbi:hypothetical protein JNK13_10350 [bacterium]|nr:hypothetical protein [bacterium]
MQKIVYQISTILSLCALVTLSGCSRTASCPPGTPGGPTVITVVNDAPIPPGTTQYCWEEPIVETEENGPGLDQDGFYYKPRHTAVREVRQGKWRPCAPGEKPQNVTVN